MMSIMQFVTGRSLKRCVTGVSFWLLLGSLPCFGQTNGENYRSKGDSLYANFKNVSALEAYESALRRGSADLELLLKLARTANDVAQDAQAAGDADRAERMYAEAVTYSKRTTDEYPTASDAWFMLAATTGKLAQFRGGKEKVRIGRAVEDYYQRSIALDSTNALAYLVGGIFNRELSQLNWVQRLAANTLFGGLPDGSLEKSKEMLRKTVELKTDLLIAHWELAQTCLAMERIDEALAHIRHISTLDPQNTEEIRLKRKAAELLAQEES